MLLALTYKPWSGCAGRLIEQRLNPRALVSLTPQVKDISLFYQLKLKAAVRMTFWAAVRPSVTVTILTFLIMKHLTPSCNGSHLLLHILLVSDITFCSSHLLQMIILLLLFAVLWADSKWKIYLHCVTSKHVGMSIRERKDLIWSRKQAMWCQKLCNSAFLQLLLSIILTFFLLFPILGFLWFSTLWNFQISPHFWGKAKTKRVVFLIRLDLTLISQYRRGAQVTL